MNALLCQASSLFKMKKPIKHSWFFKINNFFAHFAKCIFFHYSLIFTNIHAYDIFQNVQNFVLCIFLYTFLLFFSIFQNEKIGEKRLEMLNTPKKLPKQGKTLYYSNRCLKLYIIHVVQSDEKFFSCLKSYQILLILYVLSNFFMSFVKMTKNQRKKSDLLCILTIFTLCGSMHQICNKRVNNQS